MALKHQGFQVLLYSKFLIEKKCPVDKIAQALGISPSTFYNYIEGVSYFPPDLIAPLYNATGDADYLTFITNETDKRLASREGAEGLKSVLEEALDVAASQGDIIRKVQKALADGNISDREAKKILKSITEHYKELEDLRKALEKKK